MQLETLETFLAVLEEGSLVKAARRLHVSQSTVTTRLRSLEDEIGRTLIHRSKSGATPTAVGQRLQRNAATMVELWAQARRDASQPDAVTDICRVVCDPDLWPELGSLLVKLAANNSAALAVAGLDESHDRTNALAHGAADVSITYRPPPTSAGIEVFPLGTDELILVATNADAPVRFNPSYALVGAGDEFALWHDATYADAGIARVSLGSAPQGLAFLMTCINQGQQGSAYIPRRLVRAQLDAGSLHVLEDGPSFRREIYLGVKAEVVSRWPWFSDVVARLQKSLL